jgi:hypothetical protein
MWLCIFIQLKVLRHPQVTAPPAVDPRVTDAAKPAFSQSIRDHIFKGSKADKGSGRHILNVWKHDHDKVIENRRDKTTGIVEFKVSGASERLQRRC